jgi:hypothetical protein
MGKTEVELLRALGPPANSSSDGKSGRILQYLTDVELGKKENVGAFSGSWTQYTMTVKSNYFLDETGKVYLTNCIQGSTQSKTTE